MIAHGVALVLTSTLFALAHGVQNFPLFFDRFAFGLAASAVAVGTANFVNPRASVDVIDGIARYVEEQGATSVGELVGALKLEG